MGEWVNFE